MYQHGDQQVVFDPWTGVRRKVKAFRKMPLVDGMNYENMIGSGHMEKTMACRTALTMSIDRLDEVTCTLPQINILSDKILKRLPMSKDMVKQIRGSDELEIVDESLLCETDSDDELSDQNSKELPANARCEQPQKADRELTKGNGLVREGEESEGAKPTAKLPSNAKGHASKRPRHDASTSKYFDVRRREQC